MKNLALPVLGFLLIAAPAAHGQLLYATNAGAITITGYTGGAGPVTIPAVISGRPVTTIANSAFANLSLTEVTIPNSVTAIGAEAFYGCSNLTNISFGNGLTTLGDFAFNSCTGLLSLTLPGSVTNMGQAVFGECSGLTNVIISYGVAAIGYAAFENCSQLSSVSLPDTVTSIEDSAFLDTTSLESVALPAGLTNIGNSAFSGSGLTTIALPNGVTTLGESAFWNTSLSGSVFIPASVSAIGLGAFTGCDSLSAINVDASNTAFSSADGVLFDKDQTTLIAYPESKADISYTVPGGVTSIAPQAFFGCANLASVLLPATLDSIGDGAFSDCGSLTGVTLPGNVASLGTGVFSNCYSLASLTIGRGDLSIGMGAFAGVQPFTVIYADGVSNIASGELEDLTNVCNLIIPGSVTNIGTGAFSGCFCLANVYIEGNKPFCGTDAFDGDTNATVFYSPATAGWTSLFAGLPAKDEFIFTTNGDGTISITGYQGPPGAVTIPSNITHRAVTSIVYPAFIWDGNLTSVTIPDSVTSIGQSAFQNCWNLTNLTLGANVASIGQEAFEDTALSSLLLPASVTSLGDYAFNSCGLTAVYCLGNAPNAIYLPFNDDPCTVYYLPGSSGWGAFADNNQFNGTWLQIAPWVPNGLEVGISPPAVVAAGAQWQVDGGNWQASGTIVSNLSPGAHTVSFRSIDGWTTPASQTAFVSSSSFANVTATYGQATSFLQVTLQPGPAVSAGAQWQIDGGAWQNSGAVLTNVTIGAHTLGFSNLVGWQTPMNQTVVIVSNQAAFATASYILLSPVGALEVTLAPANAGGACWQVDGGAWQTSGAVVTDLLTGNHDVSFLEVRGWTTPPDQTVYIGPGALVAALGTYVQQTISVSGLFEYVTNADNRTATITGYTGSAAAVAIPPAINGLPVTTIGMYAFYNASSLTSVSIPDSVTRIEAGAFEFCQGLTSVTFGTNVASIGDEAFELCASLTSLTLPNSVTNIGASAFEQFGYAASSSDGASIRLGDNIISIGDSAFADSGLTTIRIPDSVTSLGSAAFSGSSLTSVGIGSGLATIADSTFANSSLNSVTIPFNVKSIGNSAFNGSALSSVVIGDGVTDIGDYAFYDCHNLSSVWLGAGVISIGDYAFAGLNEFGVAYDGGDPLTSITIPNQVANIGAGAFEGCAGLSTMTISPSVTNIGNAAFGDCFGLTAVYFGADAPAFSGDPFFNTTATVYYPAGASGWASTYASLYAVMLGGSNSYAPVGGSLRVTINPPAVVTSADFWRVDGGTPQPSGASVSGLAPGTHTLSFLPVSGWTTPADQTVVIASGSNTLANGTYLAQLGALTVSLGPAAIIAAGAQWQIDGGPPQNSGATVSNLLATPHVVTFTPLSGWNTPAVQTLAVPNNGLVAANGIYSPVAPHTLTVLHDFTGLIDGMYVQGGFSQPALQNGLSLLGNTLYGATGGGGVWSNGTVFALNTDGSGFANLFQFPPGTNGFNEWINMGLSGSVFFGVTAGGGDYGSGAVFALNDDGTGFTNLYSFTSATFGWNQDGAAPSSGVFVAGNILYGTTQDGGANGLGTVFALQTNGGGFTNLHNYSGGDDGSGPAAGLVLSGDTLYGTTKDGGANGNGSVFALKIDGTKLTNLYSFSALSNVYVNAYESYATNSDGAEPSAGLILSGGRLYGTARQGGSFGNGSIFAVNTDGTGFTNLHSLGGPNAAVYSATNEGAQPSAPLLLAGNTLYGTTYYGGASGIGDGGYGTLFQLGTDGGGFTNLYSFSGNDGANPQGALILSGDMLYGTTASGGSAGDGTVFSFSLGPVSFQQGSLQVSISPAEAVRSGAQWQVDASAYQDSGATVSNLSVGVHTIWFTPVFGWVPPAPQTVTIANGQTTAATGLYTSPPGSLTVALLPATAVSAGAKWRIDGGSWQNSGAVVTNLSAGSYTVSSTTISGWTTPASQTVMIIPNQTTKASATYVPIIAILTVRTNGVGTLSPNYNGALLQVGSSYAITATPGTGFAFINWTGGTNLPLTVLTNGPTLQFVGLHGVEWVNLGSGGQFQAL